MSRYAETGKDIASVITELAQPVQDATIAAVGVAAGAVADYMPEMPLPASVPTAREVVEAGYDLWTQLFAAQRTYVNQLFDAIAPLTSKLERSPKPKPVAA